MARLLDRLQEANAKTARGLYTWAQRVCEQIEALFASQQSQITDIAALQATQTTLITGLQDAVDDIAAQLLLIQAAQTAADDAHRNDSISASWLSPDAVLSAADAGTDATITVANHSRKYGDGTAAAVTGSAITALAYSTEFHVYYDDPTRAGGAVVFSASTNPNTAANNAATGRHYVGSVTTPASGGGSTSGTGSRPPGYTGTGPIP